MNHAIKPLTLGNKTFPVNLIQGPLAGVSCSPFRYLTWKYSKPAFSYTEMISCKTLIHQSKESHKRFVHKDPEEGPVCFQLSANNAKDLAEGVKIATDYGADLIDLNCGCPVKKIRAKGAGSSLLRDAKNLFAMIHAMKLNTHVPVSIKIRVDGGSNETFNQDIVQMINDAGADFLTVHGRHWTENYETACHYDQIAFFVNELKIPVIGNGDVRCKETLKKMLATGCAGVMIARASVGQPWLIAKLIAEMKGETWQLFSPEKIANMFSEHVERLALLLGSEKFALIQARKFVTYYEKHLEICKLIQDAF